MQGMSLGSRIRVITVNGPPPTVKLSCTRAVMVRPAAAAPAAAARRPGTEGDRDDPDDRDPPGPEARTGRGPGPGRQWFNNSY